MQNEMLQMFTLAIQRRINTEAEASNNFGLAADGKTDTSGCEQFSSS